MSQYAYGVIIATNRITRTNSVKKGKHGMANIEIKVNTYVEKIDKLLPNSENPRKINPAAFEKLKKSLQEFPEMKQLREIVVDENLTILGGHQRIYALKELGYSDVTVKQVIGLTEKQKREFIIKDNTASGEWDNDIIANSWDVEELEKWGVPNFNFGEIDEPKEPPAKDTGTTHEVECPSCGFTFEA